MCRGLTQFVADTVREFVENIWRQRHIQPARARFHLIRRKRVFPFRGQLDQRDRAIRALEFRNQLKPKPLPHLFANRFGLRRNRARFGNGFKNQRHIADRHTFIQQKAQHGMQTVDWHFVRDQLVQHFAVRLCPLRIGQTRQFRQQTAQRFERQQPRKVLFDHFKQVSRQNFWRCDNRRPDQSGRLLILDGNPARRRPIHRFCDILPGR